jgi:hypothetical protein
MWPDHFAHCDRKKLLRHQVGTADGNKAKDIIKKGLKLTPAGKQMLKAKLSDKETDKLADQKWVWNHQTTPASGSDYKYTE